MPDLSIRRGLASLTLALFTAVWTTGCPAETDPDGGTPTDSGRPGDDGGGDAGATADGGPAGDAAADGSAPDGGPGCVLPDRVVFDAGGVDTTTSVYADGLHMTSAGRIAVYHSSSAANEVAHVWDGSGWQRAVLVNEASGGVTGLASSEIDGQPTRFRFLTGVENPMGRPLFYTRLESGEFSAGQTIPNLEDGTVTTAWFDPSTGVLAVGANTLGGVNPTVSLFERSASGTWSSRAVFTSPNGSGSAVGVGTLSDGTAFVVSQTADEILLHRRTGSVWGLIQTLVSGGIFSAYAAAAAPPLGADADGVVLAFVDAGSRLASALRFGRSDGAPSGLTTVVPGHTFGSWNAHFDIDFGPDGNGRVLAVDRGAGLAWISTFEGTLFGTAQELRPDLVFDGVPQLLYHPCGGWMILHSSRPPSEAQGSAPLVLEPLADFAPGL